ncbi:MAG: hypothetical protein IT336_00170 [Thermomicrobiales bacterium]|nr:hypothetical protein [Thermomicrobiales bacterium]
MDSVVGVLCARVKVEEKWLIEMLAEAGIPARPFPPTGAPLPIGPVPMGPLATSVAGGVAVEVSGVVVDRMTDRIVAGALLPTLRAMGTQVIDAGLAATGNRLSIASALTAAGIPRPATLLACSEDAGLAAVHQFNDQATLLPLDGGSPEIPLADRDIAEAVLEHREVLGASVNRVSLVQEGTYVAGSRVEVLVIGGAVAASSGEVSFDVTELALSTAAALNAMLLGVTVVHTVAGPVVWDVQAVPQFRDMLVTDRQSIAAAFVALLNSSRRHVASPESLLADLPWNAEIRSEVNGDVVLSA